MSVIARYDPESRCLEIDSVPKAGRLLDGVLYEVDLPTPARTEPLLATPQARDSKGAPKDGFCVSSLPRDVKRLADGWEEYAPAIERWEALTRPAPAPLEPGRGGNARGTVEFSEWMMGLEPGWVTDPAFAIPRSHQLRLIGNGVVPQQAELALRQLMSQLES